MSQLTAEQIERTVAACRAHLAEMSETFRANLDCSVRLSAGESRPFTADAVTSFDGPGLAVSFVVGEQGVLLLVPEPVPLPAWYRQPGLSENNRLQTFAHELSLQLLPADLQADRYSAAAAASLKEVAQRSAIGPSAATLELAVFPAGAAESDPTIASILVIVPVDRINAATETGAEEEAAADSAPEAEPVAADVESTDSVGTFPESFLEEEADQDAEEEEGVDAAAARSVDEALRALRIVNVPVTVSVRLAERKMPLGQVVAFVPGSLVPFNKSCEDLLDLFVNNYRYCQGEAIKIGENFGLKVAKVGVTEERKEHVL